MHLLVNFIKQKIWNMFDVLATVIGGILGDAVKDKLVDKSVFVIGDLNILPNEYSSGMQQHDGWILKYMQMHCDILLQGGLEVVIGSILRTIVWTAKLSI